MGDVLIDRHSAQDASQQQSQSTESVRSQLHSL